MFSDYEIDRMARECMRFNQFYNNAKCTTTRAYVITSKIADAWKGWAKRTGFKVK